MPLDHERGRACGHSVVAQHRADGVDQGGLPVAADAVQDPEAALGDVIGQRVADAALKEGPHVGARDDLGEELLEPRAGRRRLVGRPRQLCQLVLEPRRPTLPGL